MFQIAAHRGGNSWPSIFEAIQKGYDYIELDVHQSKDGELIVQYSPLTQINGTVLYIRDLIFCQLTNEEKRRLILLNDVLTFAHNKIGVVIDIKKGDFFYPGIGQNISKLIHDTNSYLRTWVIAFDHQCLTAVKKYDSKVRIAPMYVARLDMETDYWRSTMADGIEICNDYLCRESAELAHKNGLKLLGWCTENMDELLCLVNLGVDIITIEQNDRYLDYLRSIERDS